MSSQAPLTSSFDPANLPFLQMTKKNMLDQNLARKRASPRTSFSAKVLTIPQRNQKPNRGCKDLRGPRQFPAMRISDGQKMISRKRTSLETMEI